eukprot:gb/GECG01014470.1/.p1 GENE.gb/GECG01014470.1/~~gb/GECG01014470.1/.p1  ORF type:complete len:575 (+),score=73.47 gb/GECG01014470.1/:1-1725(+)
METMTTPSTLDQNFHLALSHLVGEHVAVKTKGGPIWRGLFYSLDTNNTSSTTADSRHKDGIGVVLKYAVKTNSFEPMNFQKSVQFVHQQAREQAARASPKNVLIIAPEDFVEMRADEVSVNGERIENLESRTKFKTDTEIGNYHGEDSRQLKAVDSSWLQAGADSGLQGLEETNARGWDQFQTNEKLFGVKATFDESQYTTELHRDKFSSEKLKWAERQAAEIEGSGSSNIHIAEERNQVREKDVDEEMLYSGVSRGERASSSSKRSFADVLKTQQQKEKARQAQASRSDADMADSWRSTPNPQEPSDNKASVPMESQTNATTSTVSQSEPSVKETASTSTPQTISTSSTVATGIAPRKPRGSLASRLNPEAKEFKVNPDAPEFVPSSYTAPQLQPRMMPSQPAYALPNNSPSFVPHSAAAHPRPPQPQQYPNYSGQMHPPQASAPPLPLSQPPSLGYSTMSMGYPSMYPGMVSGSNTYMAGNPQITTTADPSQYTMGGIPNQQPPGAYGYGGQVQYQQAQAQYYGAVPASMGYSSYGYNYHQYPGRGTAPSPAMPNPNKYQEYGPHVHWNQGK